MKSTSNYWNKIFDETEDQQLGWYEDEPAMVFELLERIPDWRGGRIFLPGAGTSVLVDRLLDEGAKLVLNDLSSAALDVLRDRLGERGAAVEWVCQNIGDPLDAAAGAVDLWIDRAVLHFLTDAREIDGYFENVFAKLKVGGHALFAEFPPNGASKCAGLDLHRYSLDELSERLGDGFVLIEHLDHIYINPVGQPRPYIYSLFKRIA